MPNPMQSPCCAVGSSLLLTSRHALRFSFERLELLEGKIIIAGVLSIVRPPARFCQPRKRQRMGQVLQAGRMRDNGKKTCTTYLRVKTRGG
ncbi:hypothetical protein LX32DRAFT_35866 [Colletotrichum zoysiae]|uniref:Uncharacterized protein n=1 Tax=Colletotrichum zoysiae TaxID=1216348 RepID=A0AAD9LXI8_9PEZI|nr:hypothetical protein LX32DRAFT_35866 [Colletotrichum zoysiae]